MRNIPAELARSPAKLRKIISEVVEETSHLSEEEDTSPCARVPNIQFIITKKLEFNIQQNFKENQFNVDLKIWKNYGGPDINNIGDSEFFLKHEVYSVKSVSCESQCE